MSALALRLVSVLALVACTAAFAAPSAPTYRCEVDGQVRYGDRPCDGGAQRTLDATPGPTAADRAAAAKRAKSDEATLDRLTTDRVTSEQQARALEKRLAGERWKQRNACAKLSVRAKRAQEDVRTADAKNTQRQKTRARRAEEDYAALCK